MKGKEGEEREATVSSVSFKYTRNNILELLLDETFIGPIIINVTSLYVSDMLTFTCSSYKNQMEHILTE